MNSDWMNSDCVCVREVDVNKAGEGELAIMVNKGTVPNSVRMISTGVFEVSFVPKEAKPHTIDIKFNSTPLPGTFCTSGVFTHRRNVHFLIPHISSASGRGGGSVNFCVVCCIFCKRYISCCSIYSGVIE